MDKNEFTVEIYAEIVYRAKVRAGDEDEAVQIAKEYGGPVTIIMEDGRTYKGYLCKPDTWFDLGVVQDDDDEDKNDNK